MQKKKVSGTFYGQLECPFSVQKIIPVNLQIHANVMRPLCVLNFIFEPLFVHVPDIVFFLKFLPGTLVNKIC